MSLIKLDFRCGIFGNARNNFLEQDFQFQLCQAATWPKILVLVIVSMLRSMAIRPLYRRMSFYGFQVPLLAAVLTLTACAPAVRPPVLPPLDGETPKDFPEQSYQQHALTARGKVYRIDAQLSELRILVYRGGELARFGHNHVISSADMQGFVLRADDILASRFDLFVPVNRLIVDDPQIRAEEGADFSSTVSEADSEGTRRNMLGDKVLDATQFSFLQLSGILLTANESELTLDVDVSMHGVSRGVQSLAKVAEVSGQLVVSGTFNVRQSDFGIEPFSALLGKLRVEDEVTIKYRIVAVAADD